MSQELENFNITKESSRKKKKAKKAEKTSKVFKRKTKAKAKLYRIKCPICLNNLGEDSICATKCGHVFCTNCLQKALVMKSVCPTCRKIVTAPRGYHPLYLSENISDSS